MLQRVDWQERNFKGMERLKDRGIAHVVFTCISTLQAINVLSCAREQRGWGFRNTDAVLEIESNESIPEIMA